MDPNRVFCPNPDGPSCGQTGQGNMGGPRSGRFANRPDPFAVGPDGPIRWPHWRTWAQTQRSRSSSLQTRPVAGSTARQAPPTSRVTTLPHPWLPG